jgi:hypothetical protein
LLLCRQPKRFGDSENSQIPAKNGFLPYKKIPESAAYNIAIVVERPDKSTAFREEMGRTKLEREDRLWRAVELHRLPTDHPLCITVTDGWLAGQQHMPCAILGPSSHGKLFPIVPVAEVVKWTREVSEPQKFADMETERRRAADEAARLRNWEASEAGRLEKLEKQLATMK